MGALAHRRPKHRHLILTLVLGLSLLALLLWGKLKLVTDVPRTAYADPKQQQAAKGGRPAPKVAAPRPRATRTPENRPDLAGD